MRARHQLGTLALSPLLPTGTVRTADRRPDATGSVRIVEATWPLPLRLSFLSPVACHWLPAGCGAGWAARNSCAAFSPGSSLTSIIQ